MYIGTWKSNETDHTAVLVSFDKTHVWYRIPEFRDPVPCLRELWVASMHPAPSGAPLGSTAIRFIAETISSERDRNGNTYHFGIITATKTGRSLVVADVGGPSNLRAVIGACFDYETSTFPTTYTIESSLPKRDWQGRARRLAGVAEHTVTCEMLEALEK